MLLEFTFENLFSYHKEAYFSMEAAPRTQVKNEFDRFNKRRILKSSIVFGANASGKSNILKALGTFRNLILKEDKLKNPFPTYAGNGNPIYLSVTLLKEAVTYRYSVRYSMDTIHEECLEVEQKGQFEVYFQRKGDDYPVLPKDLELLVPKTRKDNLFLNTAKTFNDSHSLSVFRWFRNDLIFVSRDIEPLLGQLYKLQNHADYKEKLINFLQASDLNICDFEVVESNVVFPEELQAILKTTDGFKEYNMILRHKKYQDDGTANGEFTLTLDEESDGTKKLISLALILLLVKDSTVIMDEFDDSFHLALSKAMIELFHSPENTNQFILTSHELALMDVGFKKEQIYFCEKDASGASDLYSIYDFKSEENRTDYSYIKRYQKGLFGAIPEVLVGKLKQAIRG